MSGCRRVRDRLSSAPGDPLPPAVRRHLESCAACRRVEERSRAVASALTAPRSEVEPDAGFASRVLGRLPAAPDVAPDAATTRFTRAAVRLLPAAAALLLVLLGWSLADPAGEPPLGGSHADLLTWILELPDDSGGADSGGTDSGSAVEAPP